MRIRFWLIAEHSQPLSANAIQAARLRNLEVDYCRAGSPAEVFAAPGDLILIDGARFQELSPSERTRLSQQVAAGATCYVAGRWSDDRPCALAPFAPGAFQLKLDANALSYWFTSHALVPSALRGEQAHGRFSLGVPLGISETAQPLVMASDSDGSPRPPIFAIEHGAGSLICDLTGVSSDTIESAGDHPASLVRLLENAATRMAAVAPMIAVHRAARLDADGAVACDIVMDDRPANWDYFNVGGLRRFLQYLRNRYSRIHVDFAWTPDQNRASQRYVQTLKQFNAGFVWHGLLRHVDHRSVSDPDRDFAQGCRLVEDISRRYEVSLQPVMVFPYEKGTARCLDLLKRSGFIANAETPARDHPTEFEFSQAGSQFVTLTRDSIEALTRDRMLARAAAGLPIIAAAHPRNAGLRRLARLRRQPGGLTDFDTLLDFAAEKRLRPQSLAQIAREWLEKAAGQSIDVGHDAGMARAG